MVGRFAALNTAEIKELYGRWVAHRQRIGKTLTTAEVERDAADLALVIGAEGFGLAAVQREMDKAMQSGCWPIWSAGVKSEIEAQRREVEEQKRKTAGK